MKTNKTFIEECIVKNNNIYDYSSTNYTGALNKVKIICKKHGLFEIRASNHLDGIGCKKCSYNRTSDLLFIEKSIKIHNNKFDYSLVEYINTHTKVKIICPTHGEFHQIPKEHIKGVGCNKCRNLTIDKFLKISKKLHNNKFDYSLVSFNTSKDSIKIICPTHGEFKQIVNNHLSGNDCKRCSSTKYNTESFKEKCNIVHNNRYIYDNLIFSNIKSEINIMCKIHGEFRQVAESHLNGSGCPVCRNSKGELIISSILESLLISYIREYKFENCKNKRKLPFDFYLPKQNLCIEYDGRQHFLPIFGEKPFKETIINDSIKNKYCEDNNIKLIRIKYTEKDIKKIINENVKV